MMVPFKAWRVTTLLPAILLASAAAASNTAQASDVFYVIGALPGPGQFDPIGIEEADFGNTISYTYLVDAGGSRSDSSVSGTPGSTIDSFTFGFHLGSGFSGGPGLGGNTAHLALTLTDFLPGSLSPGNFTLDSNTTPPGHPPPGTPTGGGRGAGISNVSTSLVPGHANQLLLLADLDLPAGLIDNEYDLLIAGLGIAGRTSLSISGRIGEIAAVPLPPAAPLFGAAILGLGIVGWRSRRPTGRHNMLSRQSSL